MKKLVLIAVFAFTAMSFSNTTNDRVTEEVDCVQLAFDVQTAMENYDSDTAAANWFANLVYENCMSQ